MTAPYYTDESVTLWHGDMREIVTAQQIQADLIVADPPYGETSLQWDRWPDSWERVAARASRAMWCFGSMRVLGHHWMYFMHGRAIHPTEKPVALLDPLIRYACPPGGIVLDPFAGSGATAVAARQLGRRTVLIEADERYCEAIVSRLQQHELFAVVVGAGEGQETDRG